jgi:hypothetical protein
VTELTGTLLTAEAYGRRVGLRMLPTDMDALRPVLPFWWHDADLDPERVWDVPSAPAADRVVREMELWVAEHAVDRIFVHAGVVAVDGRALLVPGRSFSGKTTLTAALLRAGAAYGSDEYAVLDADGLVHPYPRPLSLRQDGARPRVTAADLGAETLAEPLPVGLVAALRYEAAGEWTVQPMSKAAAVLRLLDNTVCAQSRPAEALDAAHAAVVAALAVEGVRDSADGAAAELVRLMTCR